MPLVPPETMTRRAFTGSQHLLDDTVGMFKTSDMPDLCLLG
jgi:hypothetical protein